jgi:hypothetical protein
VWHASNKPISGVACESFAVYFNKKMITIAFIL